jgi:hypothetical protein
MGRWSYPPSKTSHPSPVLDLAMPDLPSRDGVVHLLEKFFGVVARVQDAVILPDQFDLRDID